MASSPPGYSPLQNPLSLPKKRPSISVPQTSHPAKRRKPSIASSTSAHPLRQSSFPPDENDPSARNRNIYSPDEGDDDLDIDDEITSVAGSTISGRGASTAPGSARKRGGGRGTRGRIGRPPKSATRGDTASLIDGDASTVISGKTRGVSGARSTTLGADANAPGHASDEEASDEEDREDAANLLEGGKLTRAAQEEEKSRRAMFLSVLGPAHFQRYELWNRIHLKKEVVRRLTNQTLSQSVPASVITTVNAYSKIFAGEIIDRAKSVQREWVAAAEKLPNGEKNVQDGDGEGEARVEERDLGPLLPDHLREGLRRYKMDHEAGSVGFTGLSLEGREGAAIRTGGRRLFR